jgi:membrane protease subunit (stomatin/prohibitin family)
MGLWDKLKNEFVDIIEWLDPTQDTIVYRFERYQNEIKYGAKLTVRESQVAVFVNEGQIADIFTPKMYTLETQNMPLLTTLKGWKYGFNSPFKAEVYFLNTKVFLNQKWGTQNPVMLRDPEFGPIRLKARGSFAFQIKDPKQFMLKVVGTDGHFTVDEIHEQLKNVILTKFTDALASAKIPALDLASNYNELSAIVLPFLNEDYKELGVEAVKFYIENISLPEEVEKMLDKRSSMGILGDLNAFNKFQTGISMEEAAKNPSGNGSQGIGMGMGFAMANQMGNNFQNNNNQQQNNQQTPPPMPPPLVQYFVAVNGAQSGPFDMGALGQMVKSGGLTRDSLVWKQGMANWIAAGQVTELSTIFNVPPPIPQ